ncbi:hypothetical protein LTR10_018138 [Elasticomyces elasticus]|uniref:Uncharacterized protein n=1 Tax=Exophiala sideris TaxID=1016849 RepID=A0ABR0IWB8_9EURO|nr:hypothetical protein LTR10_018138 [Elasticomyces elasticus]KAK5021736.1 hypothetical protein LTS07_010778 [Exophiala sideris]KAK5025107.1 hypothetical protein LTR13_010544 [Exophiala sideris]KAK5050168.1 hypothetical protein LTR69_010802 [Exophiala sideris]KAK5176916.1 hypothetical protein LTR44_010612 [Eurotiomycetes sp. CCFEE 6388]
MLARFTEPMFFEKRSRLRESMTTQWNYPAMLWHKSYNESNGYAGSARHEGAIVVDTSWFHFLIKQLKPRGLPTKTWYYYVYEWYEMSFYIYTIPNGATVMFCMDTPPQFGKELLHTLNTRNKLVPEHKLAFLQSTVLGQLLKMYDHSVWTIRDVVRDLEKERDLSGATRQKHLDFAQMHDLARHIIHTCEIIAVACDNITELLAGHGVDNGRRCQCLPNTTDTGKVACSHNDMASSLGLLRNLGRRAEALNARLRNEINLGFNLVVQHDSASMKTIAVVTLAFLPATFVSTVFSMSFFSMSFNDDNGKEEWNVSNKFWIYWVLAVPLTILTLLCWTYGQRAGGLEVMPNFRTRQGKA